MTSRLYRAGFAGTRLPLMLAGFFLAATAGCTDSFNAGTLSYTESERLAADLKDKADLQTAVRKSMVDLFGENPQHIKVPAGMGLPDGGIHLGNYIQEKDAVNSLVYDQTVAGEKVRVGQAGGFALYRQHCLHCHGVSGAGDGPTSAFLYPRPRDYRRGVFKFTSTPTGFKPARDDLRKTILNGLHGTSMPAFEALMTGVEVEQVVDYMMFLAMRGETELAFIDEASTSGELPSDVAADVAKSVFNKWKQAESQVMNPPVARTPTGPESVARGRALFLGLNTTGNKVDCTSCHGPQAVGNGPSFVSQDVFNDVVFGGKVNTRFKLTSGQLKILDVLASFKPAEASHGEAAKAEVPKSATLGNVLAALKTALGVTDQDKPADIQQKTGYDPVALGQADSYDTIATRLIEDLEEKSLVSHSFGLLGGGVYEGVIDAKTGELWNNSLDDWGMPLRPANLNRGVYKGGRRPIDLYWRIAKGINGAKMPAHYPTIEPEKIWDLVNFVLALPTEPGLLEGATLPKTPIAPLAPPAVAASR